MKQTYKKFKKTWETSVLVDKPNCIRKGQSLINYLFVVWPKEYNRIIEHKTNDCFYLDKLIPKTLKHLEKVWKNFPN